MMLFNTAQSLYNTLIITQTWIKHGHDVASNSLLVCFDSLHPSQEFFSQVVTGLPGLNHYYAVDKVSY